MKAAAALAALLLAACGDDSEDLVQTCLLGCDARLAAVGCSNPVEMERHDRACRTACELAMPRQCAEVAVDLWYCEADNEWRCRESSSHPVTPLVCIDEDATLAACLIGASQ